MTELKSELPRRALLGTAAAVGTFIATNSLAQDKSPKPETIAIIGTGNVGATLGKAWAAKGHRIVYGSRSPDSEKSKELVKNTGNGATVLAQTDAAKGASIVLLAAPSQVALDLVATLGDLSGKIVIDAMNAMSFKDGKMIEPDDALGLATQIQAKIPGAFVVLVAVQVSSVQVAPGLELVSIRGSA